MNKKVQQLLANMVLTLSLSTAASMSVAQGSNCNEECLIDIAGQYMSAAMQQDWSGLPWADQVGYTENNVAMMIGDGFWGAVGAGNSMPSAIDDDAYTLADPVTGNVLWYGITEEHGQAAYYGMRLKVVNREITEVEAYLGREGTPDLFSATADYRMHNVFNSRLRSNQTRPREKMIAIVDGYYNTKQLNDGALYTEFDDNCRRITNGVDVTEGEHWAAQAAEGCQAQMEIGVYKPVDRIRARQYSIVDEERGVVVALVLEDHATRYTDYETLDGQALNVGVEYPNTRGMLEIFKIIDGKISRIEGVSVFLPYYIQPLWD